MDGVNDSSFGWPGGEVEVDGLELEEGERAMIGWVEVQSSSNGKEKKVAGHANLEVGRASYFGAKYPHFSQSLSQEEFKREVRDCRNILDV